MIQCSINTIFKFYFRTLEESNDLYSTKKKKKKIVATLTWVFPSVDVWLQLIFDVVCVVRILRRTPWDLVYDTKKQHTIAHDSVHHTEKYSTFLPKDWTVLFVWINVWQEPFSCPNLDSATNLRVLRVVWYTLQTAFQRFSYGKWCKIHVFRFIVWVSLKKIIMRIYYCQFFMNILA